VVVTQAEFNACLAQPAPPAELSGALQALWWVGKDDWDEAHKLVMAEDGAEAAWVHAYLHRVEGDLPNARYWYAKAQRPAASNSVKEEWSAIVAELLARK
jgi:hypothetical protein